MLIEDLKTGFLSSRTGVILFKAVHNAWLVQTYLAVHPSKDAGEAWAAPVLLSAQVRQNDESCEPTSHWETAAGRCLQSCGWLLDCIWVQRCVVLAAGHNAMDHHTYQHAVGTKALAHLLREHTCNIRAGGPNMSSLS